MKTKDLVIITVDGCVRFGVVVAIIHEERALARSYEPIEGETIHVETMDLEGNKKVHQIYSEDEIGNVTWDRNASIGYFASKSGDFKRAEELKAALDPKPAAPEVGAAATAEGEKKLAGDDQPL